jgi:hypothetical protein
VLLAVIITCEVGFWVLLGAGLVSRYLLRLRRLGTVLLLSTPLVDLVLFVVTVLDLRGGATATFAHGLAAAYIGFSIAFGHSLVRWADQRFAHRFAGGPPPWRPPKGGRERAAYEWREWFKGLLGWAVACALLAGGTLLVGDPQRGGELVAWIGRLTLVIVIWLLGWPVWASVSAARRREEPDGISAPPAPRAADRQPSR